MLKLVCEEKFIFLKLNCFIDIDMKINAEGGYKIM